MAFLPPSRKFLVVECKGCRRDVPAGLTDPPSGYIAVRGVLCGEHRRYLPTQVGLGYPNHLVKPVQSGVRRDA
jgi:hypothetical protein